MNKHSNYPEIECENASDLLMQLDSLEGDEWLFRGHPDNAYRLIAPLWRNSKDGKSGHETEQLYKSFCKLIQADTRERIAELSSTIDPAERITKEGLIEFVLRTRFENYLLSQFYCASNNAGLKIPNHFTDYQHLYNEDTWLTYKPTDELQYSNNICQGSMQQASFWGGYINKALKGQPTLNIEASIPQHYGLPTRLLDWTTNRRKAAYFSAYNPSKQNTTGKMAIFAIKKNKCRELKVLNRHLRHENPFLHAQEGAFTDIGGYAEKYFLKTGVFPSLEDMYGELSENTFLLKKYTLSTNHIRELLAKLEQNGIYRSTMMPHYTAVVEQIKYDLDST